MKQPKRTIATVTTASKIMNGQNGKNGQAVQKLVEVAPHRGNFIVFLHVSPMTHPLNFKYFNTSLDQRWAYFLHFIIYSWNSVLSHKV